MYGYGLGKKPAIAYAPAFGRTTEELLKKYHCYDLVKKGLSSMYALSARDQHTREMIFHMTGRDVPLVNDPVLLYSGRKFHVPVRKIRKRYLLVYAYDRNMTDKEEIRNIRYYAKKHGLITVSLGHITNGATGISSVTPGSGTHILNMRNVWLQIHFTEQLWRSEITVMWRYLSGRALMHSSWNRCCGRLVLRTVV